MLTSSCGIILAVMLVTIGFIVFVFSLALAELLLDKSKL